MPIVRFQWTPREEACNGFCRLTCHKKIPTEPVEKRKVYFPILAGQNAGDKIEFTITEIHDLWTKNGDVITIITLEISGFRGDDEEGIACHVEAIEELTGTYGWSKVTDY